MNLSINKIIKPNQNDWFGGFHPRELQTNGGCDAVQSPHGFDIFIANL